jgi:hypothetical protein
VTPNPSSGTLAAGTYFTVIAYADASGQRQCEKSEQTRPFRSERVTRGADLRKINVLLATLKNRSAGNGTEKKAPPPAPQNKTAAAWR